MSSASGRPQRHPQHIDADAAYAKRVATDEAAEESRKRRQQRRLEQSDAALARRLSAGYEDDVVDVDAEDGGGPSSTRKSPAPRAGTTAALRLSIVPFARTISRNPAILVLDEPDESHALVSASTFKVIKV